jgi:hypothetical protein
MSKDTPFVEIDHFSIFFVVFVFGLAQLDVIKGL